MLNKVQFFDKYNLHLTTQQQAAVESVHKPTLLLAVPGSGKTTTLVARAGYMIYCLGIDPEKILTITYTVAASKDMKSRFAKFFGSEYKDKVKFQTINSLCLAIINHYNSKAFNLLENNTPLIIEIMQQIYGEYPTDSEIKAAQLLITYAKNMMLKDEEISKLNFEKDEPLRLYRTYVNTMRERQLMDFDDQMVYAYMILTKRPDILLHFQEKYPYICVDEAQDTSKIQHEIIRLLANRYKNIFMVGDEDQSIYGFRAAYPAALMEFEKNYPGAQVLLLEENFRSTPQIVSLAGAFIEKNKDRHKKKMFTANKDGAAVERIICSRQAQYAKLAEIASEENIPETAILYRNNDSAIPIIYTFRNLGIPFRWKQMDLLFFSSPTVLLVKAILQLSLEPRNVDIFQAIYYKLGLMLKKSEAFEVIEECLSDERQTIFSSLTNLDGVFGTKQDKIWEAANCIERLKTQNAYVAISEIAKKFNHYSDDERFFLLKQIAETDETIEEFLNKLDELQQFIKDGAANRNAKVILSTIHSSKGLEYERVILIDAIEGILPQGENAKGSFPTTIDEDRRLFYVGATRAKETLLFLGEKKMPFVNDFLKIPKVKPVSIAKPSAKPAATCSKEILEKFAPGTAVCHSKFGNGTVKSVKDPYIEIRFPKEGTRKFALALCVENGVLKILKK